MKRLEMLCLAVVTGAIAFAQQPTEWLPSIADDNKAASWEDTSSFLTTHLRGASWHLTVSSLSYGIPGIDIPRHCELLVHERLVNNRFWTHSTYRVQVEDTYSLLTFNNLDPLTIAVSPSPNPDSAGKYLLKFEAANGTSADSWKRHTLVVKHIKNNDDAKAAMAAVEACTEADCTVTTGESRTYQIGDFEMEEAHRLARGLMHAVLLCGGTKAVSPF